jgi:hypothetical protein
VTIDIGQIGAFVADHRAAVVIAAGIAMAVLSGLGWWSHKRKLDLLGRFFDWAAVIVAVALSAEGMWEAATEKLGLGPGKALLLFAFAELAMLRAARRARVKVHAKKKPGVYGFMVWGIAIAAGLIAASNAPNTTEFMIRLGAPLLVAGQWWADLLDKLRALNPDGDETSSWVWTPRRIGVHFGLIQPDKQDLKKVDRTRRVRRMVRLAAAEQGGGRACPQAPRPARPGRRRGHRHRSRRATAARPQHPVRPVRHTAR